MMKMKDGLYLLLFIFLVVVVFILSPHLDQQLASLSYDVAKQKFYGELHLWCKIVYYGVNIVTLALIVVPLVMLIYNNQQRTVRAKAVKRMVLISYLSLAIGPGLLVNTILKDNWGRARPYQVLRDHHPYSTPWQAHFDRPADNSFPSGHVSIGAFLGVPFIAYRRRKLGISLCVAGFSLVGLVRFLQGGHYFSDIVIAALLVWLVNYIVTKIVDKYFMKSAIR